MCNAMWGHTSFSILLTCESAWPSRIAVGLRELEARGRPADSDGAQMRKSERAMATTAAGMIPEASARAAPAAIAGTAAAAMLRPLEGRAMRKQWLYQRPPPSPAAVAGRDPGELRFLTATATYNHCTASRHHYRYHCHCRCHNGCYYLQCFVLVHGVTYPHTSSYAIAVIDACHG